MELLSCVIIKTRLRPNNLFVSLVQRGRKLVRHEMIDLRQEECRCDRYTREHDRRQENSSVCLRVCLLVGAAIMPKRSAHESGSVAVVAARKDQVPKNRSKYRSVMPRWRAA